MEVSEYLYTLTSAGLVDIESSRNIYVPTNARLGRGLVFDDEFAARGCASDAISDMQPISEAGGPRRPAIWAKEEV